MNGHKTGKGSRGPRGRGVITGREKSGSSKATTQSVKELGEEELLDDTICCDNPVFEDHTLWGRTGRKCLNCGVTWVSVEHPPEEVKEER